MVSLYQPLDEGKDEFRLLTLLPESRSTGVVHCTLRTCSLGAYTPEYLSFLRTFGSSNANPSKRNTTSTWIQSRLQPQLAHLAPLNRLHATHPPASQHRFVWGDYVALSYVWGDEQDRESIVLNGSSTWVTSNLARALHAFAAEGRFEARRESGTSGSVAGGLGLWVDALCINQGDLDERARQVMRMRDIYGSAWAVIAWLGESSFKSASAVQLVRDLAELRKAGASGEDIQACLRAEPDYLGQGCWLGLQELMERPYWYRLWIIQEMVMGASATWICCGLATLEWTTFCDGVAFLEEHLWLVKDDLLGLERLASTGDADATAWTVTSLHMIYQDLSLLSEREERGGEYPSFGRLLDIAISAECKDPRDKVYALAALMPPDVANRLQPDYTLAVGNAYAIAARAFIEVYDNMEPIREGNPWGSSKTPSWAADWCWEGRVRSSRIENQLWGPPEFFPRHSQDTTPWVPYQASGDSRHDTTFSEDGLLLMCSGFIIDAVSGLAARGKTYFHWDKRTIVHDRNWKSSYGDVDATSQALYRTLILDRVTGGQRATARHSAILSLPSTFARGVSEFSRRGWTWLAGQKYYYFRWEEFRGVNKDLCIGNQRLDDFFSDEMASDTIEFDYSEVYSSFDRASQKRRFMVTKNGYMGWVPDNIYGKATILFGCSTPIVIRPHGSCFQVIGEAYVQGLMDGEAMTLVVSGGVQRRGFTFC
ncbi:heterokaryon incompatibility protein [Podospora aff. communis PSN243]|uniref:Heterokaryon incompatibility protein n=1 Tax=Podospora aff. communis PSN243 TaxID=3040156 RepID=A0AAV9GBW7_9PEZI|nr:heterokaryon incompatibility protein [Podospora aff. communis PSN243]